ncbi:MAG: aminoacyl-tRNA hydrolase [Candidatus Yanofskybacteria bacterium CG10_big_fil_rev_8_21_14_0_10_46_23]|uniref:Peptidyl-tRNA hydrolase n=1 Tax=Candidatus Yanofskybacteria bacterium CG10_big_fil_rev_8_21_14_0_10_46_23 TaxID=1975098 RepID=A0A2H0R489_9BACT|nr:MAG: aminoacyl-tRNA hydrolase [Candidatus Yanofskybacteria bacterium CG10_big_fil_rev_8_21_14_0_10_46_23]
MWLILGIGNPEKKYESTRHNAGFMAVEIIAKNHKINSFREDPKLQAQIAEIVTDKNKVILAKPMTYVNKTGEALKKIAQKFKIKPDHIIIIQDDLDIPFGKVKNSFDKNDGGHKGIASIIATLRTKKFYRVRIGLANPSLKRARDKKNDSTKIDQVSEFVLKKFSPTEIKELPKVLKIVRERTVLLMK